MTTHHQELPSKDAVEAVVTRAFLSPRPQYIQHIVHMDAAVTMKHIKIEVVIGNPMRDITFAK